MTKTKLNNRGREYRITSYNLITSRRWLKRGDVCVDEVKLEGGINELKEHAIPSEKKSVCVDLIEARLVLTEQGQIALNCDYIEWV